MSLTERWHVAQDAPLEMEPGARRPPRRGRLREIRRAIRSGVFPREDAREEGYEFRIDELNWPNQGGHSKQARVERLEPDVRVGPLLFPAVIFEPGKGECFWHVDEAQSTIVRVPMAMGGLTKPMKRMQDAGQGHLLARAIKRLDEDRKPYDVSMALIEEMLFFPFAPHDELGGRRQPYLRHGHHHPLDVRGTRRHGDQQSRFYRRVGEAMTTWERFFWGAVALALVICRQPAMSARHSWTRCATGPCDERNGLGLPHHDWRLWVGRGHFSGHRLLCRRSDRHAYRRNAPCPQNQKVRKSRNPVAQNSRGR